MHEKFSRRKRRISDSVKMNAATVVESCLPEPEICTGCGVCSAVCPSEAIRMEADSTGFMYPVTDTAACTGCDECAAHCPVFSEKNRNFTEPDCYAVQAAEPQRMQSASGGFAAELSAHILRKGGFVCGAAFTNGCKTEHILISRPELLPMLTGVKYTQSSLSKTLLREIRALLTQGRTVLFFGCPCQVAGLYSFLEGHYDTLYTVDIVCRGVTSEKLLRQYCKESFPEKEAVSIAFRNKKKYGWSNSMTVKFSDGTVFQEKGRHNLFYELYQADYSLRPACGGCAFTGFPRQGDLTCGDLWSVSKLHPEWNDQKGTSFVLLNNARGEKLYKEMHDVLAMTSRIPLREASAGNRSLLQRPPLPAQANRFLQNMGRIPMAHLFRLCRKNRYDVGIAGLWYGLNYGSILTYYALYCVLHDMGYEVMMLEKPEFLWSSRYTQPDTIARRFICPRCNVGRRRENTQDWRVQSEQCDTFLIGSDVVWNYEICGRHSGSFFFLDFVPDNKKKLAYAASFGGSYNAPEWMHRQNRHYLQQFDGVSVREEAAVQICSKSFGIEAAKVLDPVFLCRSEWFTQAAADSSLALPERYVMSYILGANQVKSSFIRQAVGLLHCEMRNVVNPNNETAHEERLKLPIVRTPSVEDWLRLIQNCTLFIGDSFHGLCFSILFRRRFVIFVQRDVGGRDRFTNLLKLCGLEDRLFYADEDVSERLHLLEEDIDYDAVEERLRPYREESLTWLRTYMQQPKQALKAGTPAEMEERLRSMQYEISALQRELEALKEKS